MNDKFQEKNIDIASIFRDTEIVVNALAMVCDHCGKSYLTDDQANLLKDKTLSLYNTIKEDNNG